jgi:hypothetical protein
VNQVVLVVDGQNSERVKLEGFEPLLESLAQLRVLQW